MREFVPCSQESVTELLYVNKEKENLIEVHFHHTNLFTIGDL